MIRRGRVALLLVLMVAAALAAWVLLAAPASERPGLTSPTARTDAAPAPRAAATATASEEEVGACGKTPKCQYKSCDDCERNPKNQAQGR